MKYQAIIFDMDGTILDTEQIWHDATSVLLASRGISLSDADREDLKMQLTGCDIFNACALVKLVAGIKDDVSTLVAEKAAYAQKLYPVSARLADGFDRFHARAKECNLSMAIATNAESEELLISLKEKQLGSYFGDHIYGITRVNNKAKPDPAIYLYAAHQLGIDPALCIAVEDSAHGIRAAQEAGMLAIGIHQLSSPEQTRAAHVRVGHFDEINLDDLLNS